MKKGNVERILRSWSCYRIGTIGLPQDHAKANELYLKGGELGCAGAYFNLGVGYQLGQGVEVDMQKAKHYYELAAINGSIAARQKSHSLELFRRTHIKASTLPPVVLI